MSLQSGVQIADINFDRSSSFESSYKSNNGGQNDCYGISELVKILRARLREDTQNRNLRKTAAAIEVSHPWLAKFRDGHAVCMGIINALATHYGIRYQISNFDPEELQSVAWEFPENP